jgi:predicted DNA-binding antitoxin AbrB/MazE fold protein
MTKDIRVRVGQGVLELLDPVDLPEGTEVTVTIRAVSTPEDREAFRRAAGGWQGTMDAAALITNIYADRLLSPRPAPRL